MAKIKIQDGGSSGQKAQVTYLIKVNTAVFLLSLWIIDRGYARYFGFIKDNHVSLHHSSNFGSFFVLDFEIFA